MASAAVTSKGQITIPAEVRAKLGVSAGDRVEFIEVAPGRFEVAAATISIRSLKGAVRPGRRPVSVVAMNQAIRLRGAKAR